MFLEGEHDILTGIFFLNPFQKSKNYHLGTLVRYLAHVYWGGGGLGGGANARTARNNNIFFK